MTYSVCICIDGNYVMFVFAHLALKKHLRATWIAKIWTFPRMWTSSSRSRSSCPTVWKPGSSALPSNRSATDIKVGRRFLFRFVENLKFFPSLQSWYFEVKWMCKRIRKKCLFKGTVVEQIVLPKSCWKTIRVFFFSNCLSLFCIGLSSTKHQHLQRYSTTKSSGTKSLWHFACNVNLTFQRGMLE